MEPVRPGLPSGEAFPDSVYFILENPTPQTRVTYADAIHSDFEKEDTVGCFALDADLNVISESTKNARYRVSVHTNVETGEDRRFLAPISDEDDLPRNDSYNYLFYYPYDKNVKELSDLQKYSHMILANQNQREKYEASDLLWDICAPDPTLHCVFVKMDHAMSNVIVEVEPSLIKEGTVPTLLGRPKGVRQLNLVRGSLEEMENNLDDVSYLLVDDTQDIIMWEFGRANSGNYMFRAIVPSNHIISPGTTILSLVNTEGNTVRYKTSMNMSPISFLPGRNYYLNIVEAHDYVAPEIGDDETWVYDVLDPETGQPVGLLCREYLRYQPGRTNFQEDVGTGTPHPSESDVQTKYINSQAWVFYKLRPTGEPNLNEGQVLRFIYDVVYGPPDQGAISLWPYPYEGYPRGGMFTPLHGHTWTSNISTNNYYGEGVWGKDSETYTDYFMHGGTITWDGSNNKISWFDLPKDQITNTQAESGHIAIPFDGGEPFLCYHAITDQSPHKVGILSPHYLVDRRIGKQRGVEERLYPLVKIGYNQFWMSLSLRAATQIDGTELTNYNTSPSPGVDIPSGQPPIPMKPGFLYVSKQLKSSETVDEKSYNWYDPWNDYSKEEREKYKISVMYNHLSLTGAGMLPISAYSAAYYNMPNADDFITMMNYLGCNFGPKIMTRGLRERKLANSVTWLETEYEALRSGKYLTTNMDRYSANICGFDLRAEGLCKSGELSEIGDNARVLVKGYDSSSSEELIFGFPDYLVWQGSNTTENIKNNTNIFINVFAQANNKYKYFAPIRFFLKFNNQEDNGGSVSVSSVANALKGMAGETKAPSEEAFECRDVYIGLEAVE